MDVSAIAAENRWIGTQLPLVARDGSRIVAYRGLASRRPGVAHRSVDVGAGARRRGIGRALISRAIAWARASGFRKIALNVFAHHTAAIALYESHGFQREGVLRRHISRANGERWDAVAMRLLL